MLIVLCVLGVCSQYSAYLVCSQYSAYYVCSQYSQYPLSGALACEVLGHGELVRESGAVEGQTPVKQVAPL